MQQLAVVACAATSRPARQGLAAVVALAVAVPGAGEVAVAVAAAGEGRADQILARTTLTVASREVSWLR
jgi:hypothetical protein